MNMMANVETEFEGVLEDTTITINQWLDYVTYKDTEFDGFTTMQPQVGLYLRDHIIGWMDGPVALFRGKPITAETFSVECLKEFKKELENSDRKFIMYEPRRIGPFPEFDKETHEFMGFTDVLWSIRGCYEPK